MAFYKKLFSYCNGDERICINLLKEYQALMIVRKYICGIANTYKQIADWQLCVLGKNLEAHKEDEKLKEHAEILEIKGKYLERQKARFYPTKSGYSKIFDLVVGDIAELKYRISKITWYVECIISNSRELPESCENYIHHRAWQLKGSPEDKSTSERNNIYRS